jgi:uncharacterized protein (UPF0297 family)
MLRIRYYYDRIMVEEHQVWVCKDDAHSGVSTVGGNYLSGHPTLIPRSKGSRNDSNPQDHCMEVVGAEPRV